MTVDKSETRIRQMFSAISPRYDLLNHVLSLNVDRYWRWRTTRAVPVDGEAPLLDLATGTGDLALAYLRQSAGRVPIVAADFCREMLVIGGRKAQHVESGSRIRFVEADAQRLPFPDDHFQIVCIAFGLRNVTDMRRGLGEMVRVAKPGGRLAILEFSMPRNRLLRAVYGFYFRRVLPFLGQALARNRAQAYHYLPASVLEFPQGEQMLEIMRQAGLEPVSWQSLTFGVASLYVGTKRG
jgi:demethylmenaquinone methyltransferase/2-methoxy-6-polyprenyl-1,4-benzoquinol methylase